ncbi:hypothetical protein DL89DRAFT_143806 [Linderina pennispora]|uniref:Uncharacterized protein n=1 Tax=Linderina pennispora TaxID=61395 RepID=A0A1Y1WC59_9FUNG|nr:uncharacterized protein DL89DRAFT_143806 [Linderina pennispora]ORX70955.1 hypothetical protein DL89DRAFT_143806 [Linderina pennispora]
MGSDAFVDALGLQIPGRHVPAHQARLRAPAHKSGYSRAGLSPDSAADTLVPDSYRQHTVYLDHWKIMYAQILYMWQMDVKAVEVLKCIQNPDLLQIYNSIACQPSVPKHDNMARIGNPVLAEKIRGQRSYSSVLLEGLVKKTGPEQKRNSRPNTPSAEISGAPWLSCAWCHEYVHGRALICHACGHGGHQEHMLKWFKTVLQQIRKSGLSPAHIGGYSADALPVQHVLSDNSAGASSAPSGLASRINTAGNTRTHTRNPTLSADVLPAVTISPAPGSVVSVNMPSDAECDSDDSSSVDSTDQSSPERQLAVGARAIAV